MNIDQFLRQRKANWQRLETLLDAANANLAVLSEHDLTELGRLYRQTASDLALARRDFPSQRVTVYLNRLVGRAHGIIYHGKPLHWQQIRAFYQYRFGQLYRALLPYTILSALLFAVSAVLSFAVVWHRPDRIYILIGPQIAPLVREVEAGKLWTEIAPTVRSAASALILTNNIRVTFFTFAGGITGGLLSLWIIITNGIHIGALFGLLHIHHLSSGLGQFVAAHGFVELSVIFLAGGCGLYIGDGLLRPGLSSRPAALVRRAQTGVQLILGCMPLLILAGLVEGFVSPSSLPWPLKLALGLGSGLLLHTYWLRPGRITSRHHT